MRRYLPGLFLILALILATLPLTAFGYEFYHVAVRDYDGNGIFDGGDQIRYGFDLGSPIPDTTDWRARAYDSSGTPVETVIIEGGTPYTESLNGSDWTQTNYWKANFSKNGIAKVELYNNSEAPNDTNTALEKHFVNLPDISSSFDSYAGFNPKTVSWIRDDTGGIDLSWQGITQDPNSSYRIELSTPDWDYSILQYLDGTETELTISNALLSQVTGDIWNLRFQQRFENEVSTADNPTWLRSYSAGVQVDFSASGATAAPIPGAVWMLGTGLIGLVGIRRKFKN